MRAGAASALAHVTERIAAVNELAWAYGKAGHVTVKCADAIAMVNHYSAAIAIHLTRKTNNAIRRGDDARPYFTGDIHASVECAFTTEWINTFAK